MENHSVRDKRVLWLDLVRIYGSVCVVLLHVSNYCWSDADRLTEAQILAGNVYSRIFCVGVTLFVMVSGYLFLQPNRKVTFRLMIKKYIKHIIFLIITWSIIYGVMRKGIFGDCFSEMLAIMVRGYYHMWYLYMIVALYFLTPILHYLAKNDRIIKIIAFIWLGYQFANSVTLSIAAFDFPYSYFPQYFLQKFNIGLFLSFDGAMITGYFVGTQLETQKWWNKKGKIIFGVLAIVTIGCSLFTGYIDTCIAQKISLNNRYDWWAVYIFVLIYELFKNVKVSSRVRNIVSWWGKNTLGIYLIHMLVLEIISVYVGTCDGFNPWVSIPIIGAVVYLISAIFVYLVSKVPYLQRIVA